jgi:hypothetical protein
MAECSRGSVIAHPASGSLCLTRVNLTTPAGAIGAAICAHSFANDWIRRIDGTRAVMITLKGLEVFREQFGAKLE